MIWWNSFLCKMRENFSNLSFFAQYHVKPYRLQKFFSYATYDPSPRATEAYKLIKVGSHIVYNKKCSRYWNETSNLWNQFWIAFRWRKKRAEIIKSVIKNDYPAIYLTHLSSFLCHLCAGLCESEKASLRNAFHYAIPQSWFSHAKWFLILGKNFP